jgi:hypothetical protein
VSHSLGWEVFRFGVRLRVGGNRRIEDGFGSRLEFLAGTRRSGALRRGVFNREVTRDN